MIDIQTQIESLNKSLQWIKLYAPEHYEQRFVDLVGLRCRLRKIAEAAQEKPAIAAFGESQKGKSYLIGNLLQKQKSPFMVKDEKGNLVNFVDRVNPIGDKKEATGVVTRFTPFNQTGREGRYHSEHPVIVKLFNVASLATILCDSYYMDLMDKKFYADDEIKEVANRIYEQYSNKPEVSQSILVEDDIFDIKNYLEKYVTVTQGLRRSGYFEKLALVIRRVPRSEWASVLQYLWHENKSITALFQRLVDALERLGFAREVYVDFDAVMHLGDNKNTIMSVDCLNGLDDTSWALKTNVYVMKEGRLSTVSGFPKCELCAICAETIFKIEPDYLDDEDEYGFDGSYCDQPGYMPLQTKGKLPDKVKKDLLADTDLLDFPGARNRLAVMEDFLSKIDKEAGASNLVQMLLRGKVAYLFNSYNESRIINILLFCHDNEQPNVNEMYRMINDWVEKYVGTSVRLRQQTIRQCGGVSPLFVVGTKFNIDMIEKHNEDGDSDAALKGRWSGRFMKVLYTQSFKADDVDWFKNWDEEGRTFKNTYLLRDYKYSGCDGKGNNLYDGYDEKSANPKETTLRLSPEFYNRLRNTFINNADVLKFFEDPAKAWDVAATMNNDGSLYIIERLAIVAKHMGETRKEQFSQELDKTRQDVSAIMKAYLVTDDKEELLIENINKANEIFCEMDFTCQSNPDYFGHLLQALQMSETESFKELHRLIPMLTNIVTSGQLTKQYQLIRSRCDDFMGCETEDAKWSKLMEAYRLPSKEKAMHFLEEKDIDYKKLFAGAQVKRRNSSVIVNHLLEKWQSNISDVTFMNEFTGNGKVNEIAMNMLITCFTNTAKNVKLAERIESEIAQYTDVLNVANINQDLVADIVATSISDFVMDFGFRYLTPEQIASSKHITEEHKLNCFKSIEQARQENYDEAAITQLLDKILADDDEFSPSFMTYYNNWMEYMYVAYTAHLDVREYNHEANNKLKVILDELKTK